MDVLPLFCRRMKEEGLPVLLMCWLPEVCIKLAYVLLQTLRSMEELRSYEILYAVRLGNVW